MIKIEHEKLTIYEVEELHKNLLGLCDKAEESLTLDLQNVQKIDMTATQLLLSVQKSCEKKSLDLILKNVSDQLLETFESAGCRSLLKVQND